MLDMTAIILTKNEELNLPDCIKSIQNLVSRIVVIDSFSADKTVSIAKKMGAEVFQHEFENHSKQYRYGVKVANIRTQWTLRIDADERISESAAQEIESICNDKQQTDVGGIVLRLTVEFLGKQLYHGGIYPLRVLRIYKTAYGKMEVRNMDEHIVLTQGKTIEIKSDCYHADYKDLSQWIEKHNGYSDREAKDYFANLADGHETGKDLNLSAGIKRWIKFKIYYRLPIGMRAHLYYIYRYYIKLGFLDGKEGKIFAFMQAYWYRYLVDAKIYEATRKKLKKGE